MTKPVILSLFGRCHFTEISIEHNMSIEEALGLVLNPKFP